MKKYKLLILVYLISVVSSAVANIFGIDVQILYRVPFLNIRWIDISILWIIGNYFYDLNNNYNILKGNGYIISLMLCYLMFETVQLLRTWGRLDANSQVSLFLCTLNFFILLDLCTFKVRKEDVIRFLRLLAHAGSAALIIGNMITFYSFLSGQTIITDDNFRVGLNTQGQTESIYTSVLIAYVYAFGLYFLQSQSKFWEKLFFLTAIISIYLSLVFSFARGDLFTVALISVIYLAVFSKKVTQGIFQFFTIATLLVLFYLLFGSTLRKKGYDPVEKLTETAAFAIDIDNPDWDKGRSISREYAIASWKQHIWTGVGYDALLNHGAPAELGTAHNFILTSLFHRGLVGTSIYLLILIFFLSNSVKLWFRLQRENSYESDMFKLLVIVSFFWLVPFWNQEAIWEKYSLSIEFMYLGFITSIYSQKLEHKVLAPYSNRNVSTH